MKVSMKYCSRSTVNGVSHSNHLSHLLSEEALKATFDFGAEDSPQR